MNEKYLYIVFSSTPYKMGRFIRKITGESYNHVSIALDEKLESMYGFARRYYRTPFYGGFVRESLSRYHLKGKTSNVRICRIPVTQRQHRVLSDRFNEMYANKNQYIYNHISAVSSIVRRSIHIRDAYICVEFCVEVLKSIGIDVAADKYYSVGDLEKLLRSYCIYTGPIPKATDTDTSFYARKPIPHPVITSFLAFTELFARVRK